MAASSVVDTVGKVPDPVKAKSMFILYYRNGMNPHAQFKFFFGEGEFRTIIDRAKAHCERMNYRFVTCLPAIIDFDQEEKKIGQQ